MFSEIKVTVIFDNQNLISLSLRPGKLKLSPLSEYNS